MRRAGAFLLITLFSLAAKAEYRAFQLAIKNNVSGQTRLVTSILDDIQYPSYYPLSKDESISIQDTWMCWKRGDDFQPICPSPHPSAGPGTQANPPVAGSATN